jgi:hypothetical protein
MKRNLSDSFIVDFWERIFNILSYVSIFSLVRLIKKRMTYSFVEYWVIFNTVLSFMSTIIVYYINPKFDFILWFFTLYAVLRIFEITIYQLNVLLFDPYRSYKEGKVYKMKSPTRMVILLAHNYIEIVFWFSVILISILTRDNLLVNGWGYYLRINFLCISTFDTQFVSNAFQTSGRLSLFAFYESIVGFVITIISLARFIGLLPGVGKIEEV